MMGLQEARVGLSAVRAIPLTHGHGDVASGAAALRTRSGARVYAGETWSDDAFGELRWLAALSRRRPRQNHSPDETQADGAVIEGCLGVLTTPGHTGGHLAYYDRAARALFCGDTLTFDGEQLRPMPRRATSDADKARETILRCLDMDVRRLILPGHGTPLRENVPSVVEELRRWLEIG